MNNDSIFVKEYDIIIVGSGPAGVTAAIYACRAKKSVLVIEKEAFEVPAKQYVKLYASKASELKLFPDVVDTLTYFKENNYRQIVLSAMRDDNLKLMIHNAGISHFFNGILGIKDNYAREKVSIGKQVVQDLNLNPSECLMIGDTLHDAEVAEQCGFDCILCSRGHVSKERLQSTKRVIVDELKTLSFEL